MTTLPELDIAVSAIAERFEALQSENARLKAENNELRRAVDDRPDYDPILTSKEVERMTGRSPGALRAMVSRGTFPKGFKPAGATKCIGWRKSDVEAWLDGKAASSNEDGHNLATQRGSEK